MRRLLALCLPLVVACSAPPAEPTVDAGVCECGERVCGVMDCGTLCGICEGESVCSSDGLACVAPLPLGSACDREQACGVRRKCLGPDTYLPGGYCTVACETDDDCPDGGGCRPSRDGERVCMAACDGATACRTDDGYSCQDGICEACVPTCEGRTCGSDGCGGKCGVVYEEVPACDNSGETCSAGNCVVSFQLNSHLLPTDRWDVGAFLSNTGGVLLVGGRERVVYPGSKIRSRGVTAVQSFEPATGVFSKISELPEPLGRPNAALVGNTLYVAGGTIDPDHPDEPDTASTKFHKQDGNRWLPMLAGIPEASMGGGAEAIGDTLYLLPGEVDGVVSSGFWSFVEGTGWQPEASRPTARTLFATFHDGDELWVVGGWDGSKPLSTVEVWSAAEGWRTAASLPVAVASPRVVLLEDRRLFVFGGYEGPEVGTIRPLVQMLDLDTGETSLLGTTYNNFVRQAPVVTRQGTVLLIGAHSLNFQGAIEANKDILRFLVPAR